MQPPKPVSEPPNIIQKTYRAEALARLQRGVMADCGFGERLVAFYENVRGQVEIDKRSGGRYRFAGDGVKQYAEKLREEIERRRLRFTPIDWNG